MISFELEVVGYTIALAYCLRKGLPFSAYGELLFLLIQANAIGILLDSIFCASLCLCRASQQANFLFGRISQIWANFSNKSTGELSLLTCLMNSGGSMVRVFTSIQENAPKSALMGSVIGVATTVTILIQIVLYQKPQAAKEKKTR